MAKVQTVDQVKASGIPVYCAHDAIVPIEKCVPNPRNPNRHPDKQIELLAHIIQAQGWRAPITISTRSGFIVRGHARLLAAEALGVSEVPVDYQDYDSEASEWADLVADNRIAELAETDDETLRGLLSELNTQGFDMELTGFTDDDLDDLLAGVEAEVGDAEDFDPGKALNEIVHPRIAPGEVWRLGKHRLVCGDAIKPDIWEQLFGGKRADLIVTSPPYNVGIKYASYHDKQAKDDYLSMIAAVGELIVRYLNKGRFVAWNVGVSPESYPHYHVVTLEGCGLEFYRQIVWEKSGVPYPVFTTSLKAKRVRHYKPNYKHEVIYLFQAPGEPEALPEVECPFCEGRGTVEGFEPIPGHQMLLLLRFGKEQLGDKNRPSRQYAHDIWHIQQNQATVDLPTLGTKSSGLEKDGRQSHMIKAHPAAYPVELPKAVISLLTGEGEIVCDPFMGAGATLVAAEKLGRVAYGIELDPIYCELTMQRWEALTGQKAVREDGTPYEQS